MTKTRWIIFALVSLGVLGLLVFNAKKDAPSTDFNGDAAKAIMEGPITDQIYGSKDSKVTLIEYADFQCPGCESAWPMLKEVKETYKDTLTFVYRNMPLTNIHPNALAAATAAEAAGLQGKFYEYHDLLFQNQNAWKDAAASDRTGTFETYAKQLNLDLAKFRTDLSSSDISAKINRDRSTASKFGVTSTPTLILNGQKVPQDTTFDKQKLMDLIDSKLKEAGLPVPQKNQ